MVSWCIKKRVSEVFIYFCIENGVLFEPIKLAFNKTSNL